MPDPIRGIREIRGSSPSKNAQPGGRLFQIPVEKGKLPVDLEGARGQ